jgi:hypothetical protein
MSLSKQAKQMRDSNEAKYGTGYGEVGVHLMRSFSGTGVLRQTRPFP